MTNSFNIKVKSKRGQFIINELKETSTIAELLKCVANLTGITEERLVILAGYPPRPLDLISPQRQLFLSGVLNGDTLIINEKPESESVAVNNANLEEDETLARRLQQEEQESNFILNQNFNGQTFNPIDSRPGVQIDSGNHGFKGVLLKHDVPADNSCLFTSIRFVINGHADGEGSELMRHTIAMEVESNPVVYNEAFLEKSNAEYCRWIQKPDSWGGAIEIAILSHHYGIEIDVVDVQTAQIRRFGEDKNYSTRAFLMYDGIHYDPIYMDMLDGSSSVTLFPVDNMEVYEKAVELAKEAKSSRQYTNLSEFTLRCMQCNLRLHGQVEAREHAKLTGHINFGEV